MFKKIRGMFSSDLSIDLGTANTLIYAKGEGIVLNEPSVVAMRKDKCGYNISVSAIGHNAKKMLGKTPNNINVLRPLKEGVIADFLITEMMLQYFIKKVHSDSFIKPSPKVLICVPVGATQVERRAIRESVQGAGAREVFLIEEPMAAAIGAGLNVHKASGSMVVDIGGGTTEIAVISLNGIVYSSSIRIGGNKFDESIINYVKKNHGSLIGETTAEKIKHNIGLAFPEKESKEYKFIGINLSEGIPKNITLTSNEVLDSFKDPLSAIMNSIMTALEKCPPELASDIYNKGMILSGGGSLLKNMNKLITKMTGISVILAEDPLSCVVKGGGKALEIVDKYKGNDLFSNE